MTPASGATGWTPRRKVVVGAVAGAVVVVVDALLRQFAHFDQASEVVGAEVVIVSALLAYLVPAEDQA